MEESVFSLGSLPVYVYILVALLVVALIFSPKIISFIKKIFSKNKNDEGEE